MAKRGLFRARHELFRSREPRSEPDCSRLQPRFSHLSIWFQASGCFRGGPAVISRTSSAAGSDIDMTRTQHVCRKSDGVERAWVDMAVRTRSANTRAEGGAAGQPAHRIYRRRGVRQNQSTAALSSCESRYRPTEYRHQFKSLGQFAGRPDVVSLNCKPEASHGRKETVLWWPGK